MLVHSADPPQPGSLLMQRPSQWLLKPQGYQIPLPCLHPGEARLHGREQGFCLRNHGRLPVGGDMS